MNPTEGETIAVAVSVLALAPWTLIGAMFLTGRWKLVTPSRPQAEAPAADQPLPVVPAVSGGAG